MVQIKATMAAATLAAALAFAPFYAQADTGSDTTTRLAAFRQGVLSTFVADSGLVGTPGGGAPPMHTCCRRGVSGDAAHSFPLRCVGLVKRRLLCPPQRCHAHIVSTHTDAGPPMLRTLVRLAFHDCASARCDGCIDPADANNPGLSEMAAALQPLCTKHALGTADCWAAAATVAAEELSNNGATVLKMPVFLGRKDAARCSGFTAAQPEATFPFAMAGKTPLAAGALRRGVGHSACCSAAPCSLGRVCGRCPNKLQHTHRTAGWAHWCRATACASEPSSQSSRMSQQRLCAVQASIAPRSTSRTASASLRTTQSLCWACTR